MASGSAPTTTAPLAVVLNPHAGRGLALRTWPRVERELQRRGLAFDVILGTSAEDALARVSTLPPGRTVLAVGGDGTVNSLLPALVGTRRPLGIVPVGSGNDFAGMLGLRSGDVSGALDRLAAPPHPVDALQVEVEGVRRFLLNGLGMGFDAQVAALMTRAPARLPGFGRYLWSALRGVGELRVRDVTVTVDGAVMYEGPSCLVAVMNGTRYGGGFRISPESDVTDGCVDVVLGTRVDRVQLLRLMGMVLRGVHLDDPRVRCGSGRDVTVRWAEPTHTHLDGDLFGLREAVRVTVQPGAVCLH